MIPTEKTSVRKSSGLPSMSSGAMYAGEPRSCPVTVMRCRSTTCAMPKSMSLRTPSLRIMTFSGLTSRWMMPDGVRVRQRAADLDGDDRRDLRVANAGGRSNSCFSVLPSMNSVTMYELSESVPE